MFAKTPARKQALSVSTTMLAVFRQTAHRSLPHCFPRYARPFTTETGRADIERGEALNALGIVPKEDIVTATAIPQVDLDNMHHHIPPASSPLLQFMTTIIMRHGEYAKAAKIVSRMLLHIYSMTRSPPIPVVEKAVQIASPSVRNRKMKKGGGKTTYVPQALNERQRTSQGIKWIVKQSEQKGKPGKSYAERMARQIIAVVNGHEPTTKFKEDIHKLAMVNRGVLPKR